MFETSFYLLSWTSEKSKWDFLMFAFEQELNKVQTKQFQIINLNSLWNYILFMFDATENCLFCPSSVTFLITLKPLYPQISQITTSYTQSRVSQFLFIQLWLWHARLSRLLGFPEDCFAYCCHLNWNLNIHNTLRRSNRCTTCSRFHSIFEYLVLAYKQSW